MNKTRCAIFPYRLLICSAMILCATLIVNCSSSAPLKTGFVIHFDFIETAEQGRHLVRVAADAGADVISVVPPAHVWENPGALEMLDAILDEMDRHGMSLIFARIDASYQPDQSGQRLNYLYQYILTEPGRLPNGARTKGYYMSMIGIPRYDQWLEDEVAYYAKRYGSRKNLIGFSIGPFCEPLSTERSNFLEYSFDTKQYEITQYTPSAAAAWRQWLKKNIGDLPAVNREYGTAFSSFHEIPLPLSDRDRRFPRADLAYFDFVRLFNDWFMERYRRCREIWHRESGRHDVPFILQMNGAELEKIYKGRAAFYAIDIPGWIAEADAVGLSLYTTSGFTDHVHGPIKTMVNMLGLARDRGRDMFVMESGCEFPNAVLYPEELEFIGTAALPLEPRTFIYEFIKDKFNEEYDSAPGKLVDAAGKVRPAAFNAIKRLFITIKGMKEKAPVPLLYVMHDTLAARGNPKLALTNAALYELSSSVPIRWIPKGITLKRFGGVPVLTIDGTLTPRNVKLEKIIAAPPPVGTVLHAAWRKEVIQRLTRGTAMQ